MAWSPGHAIRPSSSVAHHLDVAMREHEEALTSLRFNCDINLKQREIPAGRRSWSPARNRPEARS